MPTPRDVLNRARWARGDLHELAMTVVHRGAPGDVQTLSGARVVAIGPAGIDLASDQQGSETGFVPYHRFLSIQAADGGVLWDRHGASRVEAGARESPTAGTERLRAPSADRAQPVQELAFSVVLEEASAGQPLVLDGSAGEGGGQILRTSLALSMLIGKPFAIERIRAGRKKPGLMRQHLTAVRAAAAISNAALEDAALGSTRLSFQPGRIRGGDYLFEVGSAGSAALVLQTIALPLALGAAPSRVRVHGGTHARWAPMFPFLQTAWLPLMLQAGAAIELTLRRAGFYPAGGGEVEMVTSPSGALRPLHLADGSGAHDLCLETMVAGLPEAVAQRAASAAAEQLHGEQVGLHSEAVRSRGPALALWLTARDRHSGLRNVFSEVAASETDAEQLGARVARAYLQHREGRASVEPYLADQVMLPMAMAGQGSFSCSALTLHARTNIEVIAAFTGRRFAVHQRAADHFALTLSAS